MNRATRSSRFIVRLVDLNDDLAFPAMCWVSGLVAALAMCWGLYGVISMEAVDAMVTSTYPVADGWWCDAVLRSAEGPTSSVDFPCDRGMHEGDTVAVYGIPFWGWESTLWGAVQLAVFVLLLFPILVWTGVFFAFWLPVAVGTGLYLAGRWLRAALTTRA